MLLCLSVFLVLGKGWGMGRSRRGALSVAREGRVPLLVLLAVFARPYVDVAAKIALDRAVAVFGPGDSDATAITLVGLEALVHARRDGHGINWFRAARRAGPLEAILEAPRRPLARPHVPQEHVALARHFDVVGLPQCGRPSATGQNWGCVK